MTITAYSLVKYISMPLKHKLTYLKVCNFLNVKILSTIKYRDNRFMLGIQTCLRIHTSPFSSTNGVSLGRDYLFSRPMEDEVKFTITIIYFLAIPFGDAITGCFKVVVI